VPACGRSNGGLPPVRSAATVFSADRALMAQHGGSSCEAIYTFSMQLDD
jgi:hypothetical protein